jgi:hypothetical protein
MEGLAFVVAALIAVQASPDARAATFTSGGPHSTNNDDSCDIALLPAATLLLPYFEVDLADRNGETTLFTITNASPREQVAHITLWTDFGFPVIEFSVYLTGYDVQGLNLYDVIALGQIAPPNGTGFDDRGSPEGDFSDDNPAVQEDTCRNLPMQVAAAYRPRLQQAFTQGSVPALGSAPACARVGGVHTRATGYATIDVARVCGSTNPSQPVYYTEEIAFDNVLTGDFMQVNGNENYAQGNPLVHIRAIPEGGTYASRAADPARYRTNTPQTFYGRFQSTANPVADGRQPLPSAFMARWISGGAGSFHTSYKIWREGMTGPNADCALYQQNEHNPVLDLATFDEEENGTGFGQDDCLPGHCSPIADELPSASRVDVSSYVFPQITNGAVAGWSYLNLHNTFATGRPAAQAWVVTSMRAEGRYSVDADATPLGNGCTPGITRSTEVTYGTKTIGPADNVNP